MRGLFFILLLLSLSHPIISQLVDETTPENAQPENAHINGEWELEFSDEFNSAFVDSTKWTINHSSKSRAPRPSIGIEDWRWKAENVSLENGKLILEVHKTASSSMTNGSIYSHQKYLTQYGYFEARIKVAEAHKGTHTAFWLQGPNMGNVDGTANDGAEIDIFETAWTENYTKSVVHIDGYGQYHQANTKQYNTPGIHDGFHTWGFHWTEHFMDIYYDGVFKVRYSNPKWIVKSPEFLWLSNGASFGLSGDQYFIDYPIGYLTETQVEYIRVWKNQDLVQENDSLLRQDSWNLIRVDSEDSYGNHLGIHAMDNNPYSFWHTEWYENKPEPPHEILLDLGDAAKIYGFKYLPRQDDNSNGNISDFEFFAGNDTLNWGEAILSGEFSNGSAVKNVFFNDTIECRYLKMVALSEINQNAFTNVAELDIYGHYLKDVSKIPDYLKEATINIFPNPFTSEINLELAQDKTFVFWKMMSLDGRTIKEGFIPEGTKHQKINTGNIEPGTYLFEVKCKEGKALDLLIKK